MDKVRLGKSGLMVTRVGLGGIALARLSEENAVSVVRKALDLGINFIDTGNDYGDSENKIGKAIHGRRDGLILATKSKALTADEIREHLELSLQRLGVSSIDLYQFHNVRDFESYEKAMGLLSVLEEAKGAGKIKHIGISSHSPDVAKEAARSGRFETLMFHFNFMTREPADQLLPLCRENDIGFIAMKPMAGGMLQNANLAFKYLMQFPDAVPVVGIEKPHEIEEIVRVVNGTWELTEAEKNEMERITKEIGTKFCRRCGYCQPCTQEIPIYVVMIAPFLFRHLPPEEIFSDKVDSELRWIAEGLEKADLCIKCGNCEERCPYKLPIREMMEEHYNLYLEEKKKYQMRASHR